jgi:hypothetical protein
VCQNASCLTLFVLVMQICTCGEEETCVTQLSRAWSDSSGFLDGDSETYLSRQNGHNTDGTTNNSESSQCGGSNATHVTTETVCPVTALPSCASCDILKSELVISVNCDSAEYSADSGITSPNKERISRSEIRLNAINQQNLPNNLYQELSSVNDRLGLRNARCVQEHVCDVDGSRAILQKRQGSLESVSVTEVPDTQNSSVINTGIEEESDAHNFLVSNKVVPCGKSAISPRLQTSAYAYEDSSSGKTLLGNHLPLAQLLVCTDDDSDLTRHRTMSLHTIDHRNGLLFGRVRRVRSAPHCLEHMASSEDMAHCSSWSSVSNMFSFCSDESVIHVGLQKSGSSRTSEKRLSDGLSKPEILTQCDSGLTDVDTKDQSDSTGSRRYLKPYAVPCGKNTRGIPPDVPMTGLNQLVGELAVSSLQHSSDSDVCFSLHCLEHLLRK